MNHSINIRQVITELQSFGLKYQNNDRSGKSGAGPAEGRNILIQGIPVNVPISAPYVSYSPYSLEVIDEDYFLFKGCAQLFRVDMVPVPAFYDLFTKDGVKYNKIALLHGKDCLATTVIQKCIYWNYDKRCRFCGIELSLQNNKTIARKTPEQLAEVAVKAKKLDGVRHMVLTTGSVNSVDRGVIYICECVRYIKGEVDLPVHVQIEPPEDAETLFELKEAGVDTIGIHIESFDFDVLSVMAPAKAAFGLKRYSKAWEKSVEIFGRNQVSSFLIAGLGEKKDTIIYGAKYLAELGVYPFLVPLRPIQGSKLQNSVPPPPELMANLYDEVSRTLNRYNLSCKKSKAGCVRCGACSALPGFEI